MLFALVNYKKTEKSVFFGISSGLLASVLGTIRPGGGKTMTAICSEQIRRAESGSQQIVFRGETATTRTSFGRAKVPDCFNW